MEPWGEGPVDASRAGAAPRGARAGGPQLHSSLGATGPFAPPKTPNARLGGGAPLPDAGAPQRRPASEEGPHRRVLRPAHPRHAPRVPRPRRPLRARTRRSGPRVGAGPARRAPPFRTNVSDVWRTPYYVISFTRPSRTDEVEGRECVWSPLFFSPRSLSFFPPF